MTAQTKTKMISNNSNTRQVSPASVLVHVYTVGNFEIIGLYTIEIC